MQQRKRRERTAFGDLDVNAAAAGWIEAGPLELGVDARSHASHQGQECLGEEVPHAPRPPHRPRRSIHRWSASARLCGRNAR
jgi:hypothetical protein